jgi:hypothetical protein
MTDQKIHDGGPAFPWNEKNSDGSHYHGNPGMSLRDYFAAKFAAALMTATSADSDLPNLDYQREAGGPTLAERVAATAYRLADAMLQARGAHAAAPQCCMCGKTGLSTVEGDGGSECQLSDGRWTCSFECWERATKRDVPPAPVADGWVMVPKDEMTDAMMDAGQAYLDDKSLNGCFRLPGGFNWHEFWRAMLAATRSGGRP